MNARADAVVADLAQPPPRNHRSRQPDQKHVHGTAIPFMRYLPEHLSPLGARVEAALRERLGEAPSFAAFEGYDTIVVLADAIRSHGPDRAPIAQGWANVAVEGTRGRIHFTRTPGVSVWQWAWPPVQVADRSPAASERFRTLHVC